ncbi:MAG: S26 family signal peptidase, partial [Alphaproteobacteria bacterium]
MQFRAFSGKCISGVLRSRRGLILAGILIVFFVSGLVYLYRFEKLIIYNPTPSVEEGFYVYAGQNYAKGKLILFLTPEVVRDYTRINYSKSPLKHFLKPVLAMQGDNICYRDGSFFLNGKVFAQVRERDSVGKVLPIWEECRNL